MNSNLSTDLMAMIQVQNRMELFDNSKLHFYYQNNYIDYPMYKILAMISSYKINESDRTHSKVISNKMRYNHLLNMFRLYYRKSNNKITLRFYDKIKTYIRLKTIVYEIDNSNNKGNWSYKSMRNNIINSIIDNKQAVSA